MARTGTVDERFQSYNIEMIEVTGGRFWKPYSANGKPASAPTGAGRLERIEEAVPLRADAKNHAVRGPHALSVVRIMLESCR
jgi:hypothetical protein